MVYLLILSPGEGGVTPVVPEAPGLHTDSQMTKIHFDHLAELMKRPSKDGRKGREDSGQGCRIVESAWEPKFCAWQSA